MARCFSSSRSFNLFLLFTTLFVFPAAFPVLGCYTSIFGFGDSLIDTGNFLHLYPSDFIGRFPYGETFFHHPTGRCSDGRVIIDFLAEAFEIPLLPPYLASERGQEFSQGANFAVAGATALDESFFESRNISGVKKNISFEYQINWFKQLLPSLCQTTSGIFPVNFLGLAIQPGQLDASLMSLGTMSNSGCHEFLRRSLFIVGEIGGNDYFTPFVQGWSLDEIRSFVPRVIKVIAFAINTLIEHGAATLVVPGCLPLGCFASVLTAGISPNVEDYDPVTGCLKNWNEFNQYHNHLLNQELDQLRALHPHATIIYADYFNAALPVFHSPFQFGFTEGTLKACCGGGGPYNCNSSAPCGSGRAEAFEIPFLPPYLASERGQDLSQGANFAVAGATALDESFFESRNISGVQKNVSFEYQINWFKQLLPSLCQTTSGCHEFLRRSLFIVGEIGGNDYFIPFLQGWSLDEIRSFVPHVIKVITFAINTLIEHGATTLVVPGCLPLGCFSSVLTAGISPNMEDYDPVTGCLKNCNEFNQYHNHLLNQELDQLRVLHRHATIIYADYFNAALQAFRSPLQFGFTEGTLKACCGGGGPYNYNASAPCGSAEGRVCRHPSLYWNWDGSHPTEAGHRLIARGLIEGPYATPPIASPCPKLAIPGAKCQSFMSQHR